MPNPYVGKYQKISSEGESIIVKSIDSATRSIIAAKAAKQRLNEGDKDAGRQNLQKIFDEIDLLTRCAGLVTDPNLSSQISIFYMDISMRNGKAIMDFSGPDAVEEIIGKFEEVKKFWQDIQTQLANQSRSENNPPEDSSSSKD